MDGLLVRDPGKAEGMRHLPLKGYAKSLTGDPSSYASINWVRFKGSLHGVIRLQPLSLLRETPPTSFSCNRAKLRRQVPAERSPLPALTHSTAG